jgi:histidine ammonia-lyase
VSGGGPPPVTLDGSSLTLGELARIARDPGVAVACADGALARVERCRREIEAVVEAYRGGYERFDRGETAEPPVQDYGITTGFGEFKDVPVPPADLERLQRNILLGHAVGVGESADADDPAGYFPAEVVRATLVIRLNAFLKGHSGVRVELARAVEAMVNRGIVPLVPTRGSLGSSGDLCPLAHLFAVFLGVGRYYVVAASGDLAPLSRDPRAWKPAAALAADLGMDAPQPSYKEGLALCNGATFSTALLALAVHDGEALANAADAAAALTLEAACGCARAFDPRIHRARGLPGQCDSAANFRALVAGSRLVDAAPAVQDAYSLRCAPAVHGASRDAIGYARMVAEREINAATDNPLFFPAGEGAAEEPWDHGFRANWPAGYHGDRRRSYSAGNFHGQPVGMAADFLAIALAELADISERRTQMLLDRHHNRNLPANLVPRRGLNSGFMLAQYSAASLVSENKVLAHPASVDSIPTSANTEDHVAMATVAARKLRTVLANSQAVLAIELLAAAQAVEWRVGMDYGPAAPPPASAGVAGGAAGALAASRDAWRRADDEAERFSAATLPERREAIAARLGAGTRAVYQAVRQAAEPLLEDRPLAADVGRVRRLLEDHSLVTAVAAAVVGGLRQVAALREPSR